MIKAARRRAFTLVEILIVGVLIAIFAGLAVINIQRVYIENQVKASYYELRQFKTAMDFAFQELGFYPKLNFLAQPKLGILEASQSGEPLLPDRATGDLHYMGFSISDLASRIVKKWDGPYLSQSRSRGQSGGGLNTARGIAKMRIHSFSPKAQGDPDPANVVLWPVDLWGTPYVVYMLKSFEDEQGGIGFVENVGDEANYDLAVVSYGPDRVPGSYTSIQARTPQEVAIKEDQRLFRVAPVGEPYDYIALLPSEYRANSRDYLRGYSEVQFNPGSTRIGVIDQGSDDIVIR